ncbi:tetraspanin-16 [Sarcophilus harrisii]|uniref:Tetraspanin n=1 Tax=Sarcophilus harrisii TaxID=9305 RepID=A0A7N4PIX2_SARHA|nr:tetraspanin-16 [Sarcophilus harrisii]XP_031803426.1 tetraspanin-16 [Sarcophilus harrisii]
MALFAILKILMFLLNSILFFGGLGLLAIGLCLNAEGSAFSDLIGVSVSPFSQLVLIRYLCIVIGSILLFLGILGCFGAVKENKSLLLLFFIIILIIFLVKLSSAIIILVFSSFANLLITYFETWAVKSLQESYGVDKKVTELWNGVMKEMSCCGFHNYTDFIGSKYLNQSGGYYPSYCCNRYYSFYHCLETEAIRLQGCLQSLEYSLENNRKLIRGVGLGIMVFEVAAMAVSMILFFKIGDISYE